jgi:hypothetical protein
MEACNQAISAPQPESPDDIRLETGDIVEGLEGDAEVTPELDGMETFRWKERDKLEILVAFSPTDVRFHRRSCLCLVVHVVTPLTYQWCIGVGGA